MTLYLACIIAHIIGTCFGVGGATISDLLFFTFAKDGRIDKREYDTLKAISRIVWLGLIILTISGASFLVLSTSGLSGVQYNPAKILAKVTIVAIIAVNGIVMHRVVLPALKKNTDKPLYSPSMMKKSNIILTAGAISAVSWYSALVIGAWRGLTASYTTIVGTYLMVVVVAIVIANIAGKFFLRRLKQN